MGEWGNLRLRQQVIDKISEFIKSEKGKELGYSSASQLAEYVLRNFIENKDNSEKYESEIKKLRKLVEEMNVKYAHALANPLDNEVMEKIVMAAVAKQMKIDLKKAKG